MLRTAFSLSTGQARSSPREDSANADDKRGAIRFAIAPYRRGLAMLLRAALLSILIFALPAHAQTLRIGLQADPATLDPAQSAAFVDRVVMAAVCDKLIDEG